jgi:hypothetical protein
MDRCKQEIPPVYVLNGNHRTACFLHDGNPEVQTA